MVPQHVQIECQRILGASVAIKQFTPVGGGCINHGSKLISSAGNYFLKWNDAKNYPGMFEAEASGLQLLRSATKLKIPDVIGWFENGSEQGIILEFIDAKARSGNYWNMLGYQLASLHQTTQAEFGLDRSNYIGSLEQRNKLYSRWVDFFVEQRLRVQLQLAIDNRRLDSGVINRFESLYKKLSSLLPEEKPALLHGDLWSGNVIVDEVGEPCLIDPAVYYGHREAEIAFTKLFGGFADGFYNSYQEAYPLAHGLDQRVDIYNLYPLLVHVNLFGGGYAHQVKSILKNFE